MTLWEAGYDLPPTPKPEKIPVKKGHCPKCGKYIGRGVHFHAKACHGPDRKT